MRGLYGGLHDVMYRPRVGQRRPLVCRISALMLPGINGAWKYVGNYLLFTWVTDTNTAHKTRVETDYKMLHQFNLTLHSSRVSS